MDYKRLLPVGVKDELKRFIARTAEQKAREALERYIPPAGAAPAAVDGGAAALQIASAEARFDAKLGGLAAQLGDLSTQLAQLNFVLREGGLPPPPPKHLQVRVVGGYVAPFLDSGFNALRDIEAAIAKSGRTFKDFERILDYGCGCGRVIRTLKSLAPQAHLSGTDIDPEAIAWLEANYRRFGDFTVAPHRPPLAYPDDTFDFIYGISVLTHLPEDMQFEWLAELARITQPGGHLMLSVHGEKHWKSLPPDLVAQMERHGFVYGQIGGNYGASINLPDFYQTSYHTHDYIRRTWTRYFDVLDIQVLRMDNHQDAVLLRKRG